MGQRKALIRGLVTEVLRHGKISMSALRGALPCAPAPRVLISSYNGLSLARLPVRIAGAANNVVLGPQNGATVFAMRHQKKIAKLGRPADQRKALIRGLVTEVLRHGKITTTVVRAKAIRKYVDKMITLSKRGTMNARRQLVGSIFKEAPERYSERPGGYCRVVREPRRRRGD